MAIQGIQNKSSRNTSGVHQKKRIIVCCDGTWVDSDNGYDEQTHTLEIPSNVTRFVRSIRTETWPQIETLEAPNVPQITYYQAGVGTGSDLIDQLGGGASGEGIDEHIREAYSFICRNWVQDVVNGDDEIYLVGFSRGAYTARCIVGLLSTVGLLTKRGMDFFPEIYKDYENMNIGTYVNPLNATSLLKGKPHLIGGNDESHEEYFEYLRNPPKELGLVSLTSTKIPQVQGLGVWDTVGSLGVPGIALVDDIKEKLGGHVYRKELQFYDTGISGNVENAFQALALDEMRYSFTPCLWEKKRHVTTKLKQVWFPGVHSNIGGGMKDIELSDITLAWMMSQFAQLGLEFDDEYISDTFKLNQEKVIKAGTQKPWACGTIDTRDNNPIYKIAGFRVRTPGQYNEADNATGEQLMGHPLQDTCERIHPAVRIRLASVPNTFGINDGGHYKADALTPDNHKLWNHIMGGNEVVRSGWKLVRNNPDQPVEWVSDFESEKNVVPAFYWKCEKEGQFMDTLVEEPLGSYEIKLLATQRPEVTLDSVPNGWMYEEN